MNRILFFLMAACLAVACADHSQDAYPVKVKGHEKIAKGPFKPTWESLEDYECPEWFRDAKLGLWAHWGPQCEEGTGDWMARKMYMQGYDAYNYHLEHYGHPSEFGFKDVLPYFKAENFNPDSILAYYKSIGARYFVAQGNHHDNFDNWDSKYQEWNSVNIGPKRDLVGDWAKAARKLGLPFGIAFHADAAWNFYEPAQRHDTTGVYKDIPYDGNLTKADGKGKWWEGYDPQHLYAQRHVLTYGKWHDNITRDQFQWKVEPLPGTEYVSRYYDRVLDAINKYHPDVAYFDVEVYPFNNISDCGLRIAAHLYNLSIKLHDGLNQAVMTTKALPEEHAKALTRDRERGGATGIQKYPWQSDTCIGWWHYEDAYYENGWYKSAAYVVKLLIDIVSKNGNMLLNVPLRGDGTFDEKEKAILDEFGAWMKQNGEAVYETRPWTTYGEGPIVDTSTDPDKDSQSETAFENAGKEEIRFTKKGDVLYATIFAWPDKNTSVTIKSLAGKEVSSVDILGYGPVEFTSTDKGLVVSFPEERVNEIAPVLKIK